MLGNQSCQNNLYGKFGKTLPAKLGGCFFLSVQFAETPMQVALIAVQPSTGVRWTSEGD
jgi:hypothetical protein